MNIDALKIAAADLERVTSEIIACGDREARLFYSAMQQLIERAKLGQITAPVEWSEIPTGLLVWDTGLAQYEQLARAFTEFRLELTAG